MMRLTLLICVVFGFALHGNCQRAFPDGVYWNIEELNAKTPPEKFELIPVKVKNPWSGMYLSNEYQLTSDSMSTFEINQDVFAFVAKEEMYINCKHLRRYAGFAKVLTNGNFLVFKSPRRGYSNSVVTGAAILGGVVGAAIASAVDDKTNDVEPVDYWNLFVLSVRTGNVRNMNQKYLTARLESHPKLKKLYDDAGFPHDEQSVIRYMQLINDELNGKNQ